MRILKKKNLFFVTLVFLLFVFGLQIPKISSIAVFILFLISFVNGRFLKQLNNSLLIKSSLLLLFLLTYFFILYDYNFINFQRAIINILLISCAYAAGFSIKSSEMPGQSYGLIFLLLSMVAGFVLFSFLSVRPILIGMRSMLIMSRQVPNFWIGGDATDGPIIAFFSSLGICLAPVILWGKESKTKKYHYIFTSITIFLLFVAGEYANIPLQNRLPNIALGLSFILTVFIYYFLRKEPYKYKMTKTLIIGLVFGIIIYIVLVLGKAYDFMFDTVLIRFNEKGLQTERYEAWKLMSESLFKYPLGGCRVYIGGLNYVHNLWLDICYKAGIIPFISLILFHICHLKDLLVIVSSKKLPLMVSLVFVCIFTSFFTAFMGAPIMEASTLYFSASCFFLGIVHRLSLDVKCRQYQENSYTR